MQKAEVKEMLAKCETSREALHVFYETADILAIAHAVTLAQTTAEAMSVFRSCQNTFVVFEAEEVFEKALILCENKRELADEVMGHFCHDSGRFVLDNERYILKIFKRSRELSAKKFASEQPQHACSH